MSKRRTKAYRVRDDTSTRKSIDPRSPHFQEWLHFLRGQRITEWPAHAPVDEWVATGHWQPDEETA